MAKISLPSPNVPLGVAKINGEDFQVNITASWFQKFIELLKKTNQDTLSTNGKLTVSATSDTNLQFSYIGSDGTTRTANLTLT